MRGDIKLIKQMRTRNYPNRTLNPKAQPGRAAEKLEIIFSTFLQSFASTNQLQEKRHLLSFPVLFPRY